MPRNKAELTLRKDHEQRLRRAIRDLRLFAAAEIVETFRSEAKLATDKMRKALPGDYTRLRKGISSRVSKTDVFIQAKAIDPDTGVPSLEECLTNPSLRRSELNKLERWWRVYRDKVKRELGIDLPE